MWCWPGRETGVSLISVLQVTVTLTEDHLSQQQTNCATVTRVTVLTWSAAPGPNSGGRDSRKRTGVSVYLFYFYSVGRGDISLHTGHESSE